MRGARLAKDQKRLTVDPLKEPSPAPGMVLIAVDAVFMSPYMGSLIDGSGGFETPPRPFTPGMDAVGRVVAAGNGVSGLRVGDRVFADSYIEEPQADGGGEYAFIGCFGISAGSASLLARWPDGALATHMIIPAENLTRLGPQLDALDAGVLCRMGWLGTAHAGFEKAGFRAGDSVAILGATGLLGVSSTLVALALGAARVVAVGRDPERLAVLEQADPRIETATEPPDANHPVDVVISAASGDAASLVQSALAGLRRNGTLILLASPGTPPAIAGLVTRDITVRGSLWFPRDTPARLTRLISSGRLKLERIKPLAYPLDDVNDAVAAAARPVAPFEHVVVTP